MTKQLMLVLMIFATLYISTVTSSCSWSTIVNGSRKSKHNNMKMRHMYHRNTTKTNSTSYPFVVAQTVCIELIRAYAYIVAFGTVVICVSMCVVGPFRQARATHARRETNSHNPARPMYSTQSLYSACVIRPIQNAPSKCRTD